MKAQCHSIGHTPVTGSIPINFIQGRLLEWGKLTPRNFFSSLPDAISRSRARARLISILRAEAT